MNFKRVLVLVMAIVMMVSACATPVLAAFNTETHREHIEEVINDPELQAKYEEIKATVEYVAKDIEENHEEYYAEGYAYAYKNGYIGKAIEAIELALEKLPEINLEEVEMTSELREKLQTELDALPGTLEKLLAVLESGEASEFNGFIDAALTFESDLYLHIDNIYAILEQVGIDYGPEALEYIETVVIPAIEEAVEEIVEWVVDHVTEKLTPYYNAVVSVLGIAYDTYVKLVETIVRLYIYIESTVDTAIDVITDVYNAAIKAYNALVATLLNVYRTVENVVEAINNALLTAYNVYNDIIDAIVEFNAEVEQFIVDATNAYRYTVNLLVEIYGNVKNAVIVATQVFNYMVELWVEYRPLIEAGIVSAAELAVQIYTDVVEIIDAAYAEKDDVCYVAAQIGAYIVELLNKVNEDIQNKLDSAYVGNYELKDDSYYVALGNAPYAEALAGKLNLANKYEVVTYGNDYIDTLTKADLVTAKFDNGSFMTLVEAQIEGKIAEIVRSNSDLMTWYKGIDDLITSISSNMWLPQSFKDQMVGGLADTKNTINEVINLEAEVVELDWDKYLDEEGKEALDKLLAKVREKVMEEGVEEYFYIDINPMLDEVLAQNGLSGIFTLSFEPIVVPQVDLIVFAVENMIYGYAEFADNLTWVIKNAPADATVVLTPVNNALYGYTFKGFELSEYAETFDFVVDVLNAHLYGFAVSNENVVYVESEDAEDIYNALNVYCDHVIDGCLDTVCDRCLATFEALGHSFTNYVFNNDATCTKDGTETAKCDRCDVTDTRTAANTKTDHDFTEATCTAQAKCKVCGKKQGELAPHVLGDWRVTKDPTSNSEGMRERKCINCEYRETEAIPYNKLSTTATVAIIVVCVAVAGGVSAGVAGFLRKKNKI